jgi:Mrp family chromosome partitioning ATPase
VSAAAVHPLDPGGSLYSLRGAVDSLWSRVAPHGRPDSQRRLLFTAAAEGQGTTTVAACAAIGLARHLRVKVCLVETGAPSLVLATLLGLDPQPGLSEVLAGEADRLQALRRTAEPDLVVMPAGKRALEPGVLATDPAKALFRWLGNGVDFLCFDAPPVHLEPQIRPLLWEVDQAIVVLEAGKTRKDEAQALIETIRHAEVEVLGTVLNRYRPELPTWIDSDSGS